MALVNSCWHNRHLTSRHGTWSTCRGGYNPTKDGNYQRPNSELFVATSLVGLYAIIRAYLSFDTQGIPAGATITAASLGLYVTNIPNLNFALMINKGLWDEPVVASDFGLQTDETTTLGSLSTAEMVVGQYNWIPLNAAGIDWINQRPVEINQHESYDWQKTTHSGFTGLGCRAMSFTPQTTHTLTKVRLRMKREGSPGILKIQIKAADANHCPTGPLLASGTIDANTFTTDTWGDWYLIDLGDGATLTAGTEYCVIAGLLTGIYPNYVFWESSSTNAYPNGQASLSGTCEAPWEPQPDHDHYFIEYEAAELGGTKFCLRTSLDVNDTPPLVGNAYVIHFYSAQKGNGYLPLLDLTYAAAGASASLAGKLVAAHFI